MFVLCIQEPSNDKFITSMHKCHYLAKLFL